MSQAGNSTSGGVTVPVTVPNGGTGVVSFTPYAPITGGTVAAGALQSASTGISNVGWVLTSTGASSLPTWQAPTGGSSITTINGDSGSVTGTVVSLLANTGAGEGGASVSFVASSATELDLQVTDANSNTLIGFGAGNATMGTTAGSNTGVGEGVLHSIADSSGTLANSNTAIGYSALYSNIVGNANVAVGSQAMFLSTGNHNTAVGLGSLFKCTGDDNTAVGQTTLQNLTSGSNNIAIGDLAGNNYGSSESSNILINSGGIPAESNTIRIGTQGSTLGQQDRCFVAGIAGVTTSNSNFVTVDTVTGQLGATASAGSNFTYTDITGTSQAMVANNGYTANNIALVTFTLPATAAYGTIVSIIGKGSGLWTIVQAAGQTIHYGSSNTTTGVGGSLSSTLQYDVVTLLCTIADTDFTVISSIGNLAIV